MVKEGRKPSKGRQRIEIRRIEDGPRRQVTCSKRKGGLLKKVSELNLLCGAYVAVVIFTQPKLAEKGHVFAAGTPSVDHVLRRFAPLPGDDEGLPALEDVDAAAEREAVEATVRRTEQARALVAAEEARMRAVGARVLQAAEAGGRRFWWETDVGALGEAELPEFARALQLLRHNVQRHADKLGPSASAGGGTITSVGVGQHKAAASFDKASLPVC